MKTTLARALAIVSALFLVFPAPDWATCGGGGGGGMGGMGGSGATNETYRVPWKVLQPSDPPLSQGLAVYWMPSSQAERERSSLLFSRILSVYSQQCVTMGIVDVRTPLGQKFAAGDKLPVAVLTDPAGKTIGKAENKNGNLKVDQVEKLLESEMEQREDALKTKLKDAKEDTKSGKKDKAITLYRAVLEQKCMFPGKAKDAAKELKKLGVDDVGTLFDAPVLDHARSARIERVMNRGLGAEMKEKYEEGERRYTRAHEMDPADATPLRYLGELYRHHIGDWDKARAVFQQILDMPADPLSRAVALHGLGKMTIHEGEFKKGLALMEASLKELPLALAYRNLAVYWNSEGDTTKADYYTREALKLEPNDRYNLVFAAAFLAGNGHAEEALKVARENEALMPASYNLAAIYAQAGQKEKALELLKRHFFEYERTQAVRSKEMMEARVDAVFASLYDAPAFIALTSGADGKLNPARPMGTPMGPPHTP